MNTTKTPPHRDNFTATIALVVNRLTQQISAAYNQGQPLSIESAQLANVLNHLIVHPGVTSEEGPLIEEARLALCLARGSFMASSMMRESKLLADDRSTSVENFPALDPVLTASAANGDVYIPEPGQESARVLRLMHARAKADRKTITVILNDGFLRVHARGDGPFNLTEYIPHVDIETPSLRARLAQLAENFNFHIVVFFKGRYMAAFPGDTALDIEERFRGRSP